MSYGFDMLFITQTMPKEGDAMVFGMNMAKKIATDGTISTETIEEYPRTILNCLRNAGAKWTTAEEKKAFLRTDAARLAIRLAVNIIFSHRLVYWPKHYMAAVVGDCLHDSFKKDMVHVYFQSSTDQDYDFDEWSDKIPYFWHEKENVLALSEEKLFEETAGFDSSDADYRRRHLLYQRIFDGLSLDNWLDSAEKEEGFRMIRVNGVISDEVELILMNRVRAFIMKDELYFGIVP